MDSLLDDVDWRRWLSPSSSSLSSSSAAVADDASSFVDMLAGFVAAINWREPFLVGLCAVHVALLVIVVVTRRRTNVQLSLWLALCAAVYGAERLNALGARHWRTFATQDYFDHRGVFVSALWSAPLLVIALLCIANTLWQAAQLLITVKRDELRRDLAARKKRRDADATSATAATDDDGGARRHEKTS